MRLCIKSFRTQRGQMPPSEEVFGTLSIFDAQFAITDEKSLNRLNRELREAQK